MTVDRPAAVLTPAGDPDAGIPWHYGDPHREQRMLAEGRSAVDISNRVVVTVSGPDRLSWLDSLTTARLNALSAGQSALALILSPNGHVEHELHVVEDGTTAWLIGQPGTADALLEHLNRMRFLLRVDVKDSSDEHGVVWEPVWAADEGAPTWLVPADFAGRARVDSGSDRGGDASKYVERRPAPFVGREVVIPRSGLAARLDAADSLAGSWALEALRVAAAVPRLGLETDHRTLPHEVGWIGSGVHLAKGCYRGQEAVARVHNLGHPPRRLALLHLDGSQERLPRHGDVVVVDGREAGWVGTPARHFELGPIATAILRRSTPVDAPALVRTESGEVSASMETVVLP